MPTELLECSICPRKPHFSDLSHLLTHVGSKGHLAHLHKLQVRSHGELEASHQLSKYTVWYREHQLAELLSERMQQKEARQRGRRMIDGRKTRLDPRSGVNLDLDPNIFAHHFGSTSLTQIEHGGDLTQQRKFRRQMMQDEMDDPDYVPPLPSLHQGASFMASSPPGRVNICHCSALSAVDHDCPVSTSLQRTPESARLKGQVWPGMDLFDAATEEQARKRNQRKDGSVLLNMRANSMQVEPFEITYSADGMMRRKRHMDQLEDESNLLAGEMPVKRQSTRPPTRPKREARRRSTATRRRRTARKVKTPDAEREQRADLVSAVPTSSDSSLLAQFVVDQHSSPASPPPETKHGLQLEQEQNFDIYQDASENFLTKQSSAYNPISVVDTPSTYAFVRGVDTVLRPIPWLSQESLSLPSYDPFRDYSNGDMLSHHGLRIRTSKEDEMSFPWKQDTKVRYYSPHDVSHFRNMDNPSSDFGALSHVYAYTKASIGETSPQHAPNLSHLLQPIH